MKLRRRLRRSVRKLTTAGKAMDAKTVALFTLVISATTFLSIKHLDFNRNVELHADERSERPDLGWERELGGPLPDAPTKVDINDFLVGVIENFREDMTVGIPELKVPILDPFRPKKPVRVDVEDSKATVHANFSDLYVKGLSGFELDHMRADLTNLSLRFNLRIPWMKISGNYTLDGKVIKIIPLRGEGGFRVESHNLSVVARASMDTTRGDRLQLSEDFDMEIDFEKVELDLDNFMGGGRWTDVLLKIFNSISRDVFKKCLPLLKKLIPKSIRGELNKSLLKVLNNHLKKLPITSILPGSSADEYIDQILLNVRNFVQSKELDPMKLPDYLSYFNKEIMYLNMSGEARLYDGWLSGISSLHRTDECQLNTTKRSISLSAHLGLEDLRLAYKGHAKFMSWGPSIICGGSVKSVSFFFKIHQMNKKGATPELQEFEIVEMSTLYIELSGLGPLTWLLKWLTTGITKLMEDFIINKVTAYIKEYMENEFQKISFPV